MKKLIIFAVVILFLTLMARSDGAIRRGIIPWTGAYYEYDDGKPTVTQTSQAANQQLVMPPITKEQPVKPQKRQNSGLHQDKYPDEEIDPIFVPANTEKKSLWDKVKSWFKKSK